MPWLREFASRCSALFRKGRLDQELNEELRSHLEMLIEQHVRRGMSPEAARYAALRSFGGVEQTKEVYRDQRGLPIMETLLQDIRFGLRQLRRNPGFTVVAVLTLALGIGANTAIFSVVNAVMLRPLPFPHADRLAWIAEVIPAFKAELASGADYLDWRDQNQTLEQITAYDESSSFNLTGRGTPERVHAGQVTASFFATLGVGPSLGRSFTPEEDLPNSSHVALLTDAFWQQYFGSDRQVLGQTVILDGTPYTVMLLPLALNEPGERLRGQNRLVHIIGRLKPTVSMARAHGDLDTIRKRMQPPPASIGAPGGAPGPMPGSGSRSMMRMVASESGPPPQGGVGNMSGPAGSGGPTIRIHASPAGRPTPSEIARERGNEKRAARRNASALADARGATATTGGRARRRPAMGNSPFHNSAGR